MKRLFLTSNANIMLDRFIEKLDCSPDNLTVAFIPTAANNYTNKNFVDDDREKLLELGFKILEIDIADKTQTFLEKQLINADIVFVTGGNVFYLLEKVIESGFDRIIKKFVEDEKWYIGSSAGSILVGISIEPVKTLDDPNEAPNLKSFDGLKLIDKIIIPHFDNSKFGARIKKILVDYAYIQEKIITLTDNQALVVEGDVIETISSNDKE